MIKTKALNQPNGLPRWMLLRKYS